MIWPILEARIETQKYFWLFFWFKSRRQSHSENIWPLKRSVKTEMILLRHRSSFLPKIIVLGPYYGSFTWCAGVRQCPDFPKIGVRGHKCCHSLHPDPHRHKNWTYRACRGHSVARGLCRHRHLVVVLWNTKSKSSISNEKHLSKYLVLFQTF